MFNKRQIIIGIAFLIIWFVVRPFINDLYCSHPRSSGKSYAPIGRVLNKGSGDDIARLTQEIAGIESSLGYFKCKSMVLPFITF